MNMHLVYRQLIIVLLFSCSLYAQDESLISGETLIESSITLNRANECLTDIFVPRDEKKALSLFLVAGSQGEPLGYFQAARLLEKGFCIERNPKRAEVLYVKAKDGLSSIEESKRSGEQMFCLGEIHESGLGGGGVSLDEARRCLEESSALRYPAAMRIVGMRYLSSDDERLREEGVGLICDAALEGDRVAIITLPFLAGRVDISKVQRALFEEARNTVIEKLSSMVEKGDALAMYRLGHIFILGEAKVFEGITLLENSAKLGSVESLIDLGYVYTAGQWGVERDPKLAKKYWSEAAALGDCRAVILLNASENK